MHRLLIVLIVGIAGCGGGRKTTAPAPSPTPPVTPASVPVTPTGPPPRVLLTVSPTRIEQHRPNTPAQVRITWTTEGADRTRGTNFSTGGVTAGSVTDTVVKTTTYTLYATNAHGTSSTSATVRVVMIWLP